MILIEVKGFENVGLVRLFLIHIVLLIELVHQLYIDEDENDENVDGTLLGKPKAQFKAADPDAIQSIYEENAEAIGDQKPYSE